MLTAPAVLEAVAVREERHVEQQHLHMKEGGFGPRDLSPYCKRARNVQNEAEVGIGLWCTLYQKR